MSGRRLILRASLAASLIVYAGCQSRENSDVAVPTPKVLPVAGAAPALESKPPDTATSGKPAHAAPRIRRSTGVLLRV